MSVSPQAEVVLRHITINGSITSLEAFETHNITRLSARILELRNDGIAINTKREKGATGALYARYELARAGV